MLYNLFAPLQQFFATGGSALWAIFVVAIALWALIIERFVFFWTHYPSLENEVVSRWQARSDHQSWYALQVRRMEIIQMSYQLRRGLPLIRTLTVILPILGLLGTVNGMIFTFTVMQLFGTGNANGLAGGISEALVTTMAGLVCAVPGLYFSSNLDRRAAKSARKIASLLRVD
jgi:biopolymer transport protein ExbB